MPETRQSANENFLAYSGRLKQLHQLFRDGKGDSEEADVIREKMLGNWERMNPVEQNRARALSVDLKSLHDISMNTVTTDSEAAETVRQRFLELRSAADWDGIVRLLQTKPLPLSAEALFFMKGRAWESLGDLETAILFYEEALKISPDDAGIGIIWLDALVGAGRYEERAE